MNNISTPTHLNLGLTWIKWVKQSVFTLRYIYPTFLVSVLLFGLLPNTQAEYIITTVVGGGPGGYDGGERGYSGDGGPAILANLDNPNGIAVDNMGNLYIADTWNYRVRKVDTNGIITSIAGNGTEGNTGNEGPAIDAQLKSPERVAIDNIGNVYIADSHNHSIRKVDTNGIITTIAGNGNEGDRGDGGLAKFSLLSWVNDISIDDMGNLYIADTGNGKIRKIDTSGIINTIELISDPFSVVVDNIGNLYVAERNNHIIRKIDNLGELTTIAGTGEPGYCCEGILATATKVQFDQPYDVAVDGTGNLYIADMYNNVIRKIDTGGIITTVAGNGIKGYSGDGGDPVKAQLALPKSIAVSSTGDILYIADTDNHRIRKVERIHPTQLSLFLNSPTLLQNDSLTVTGKLQRLPDTGIDLADETITLILTAPDGIETTNTTTTNSLGNYTFRDLSGFTKKGTHTVQTRFAGTNILSKSESEAQTVLVGTVAGYAVLVQGKVANNEGLEAHSKTLNRIYHTLIERGFIKDHIRYFNYDYGKQKDINQDGVSDDNDKIFFATPDKTQIQAAIEQWAFDLIKGAPAPFYLIMVDHGSPNTFYVDENETISPVELNTWLTHLENSLKQDAIDKGLVQDAFLQESRTIIFGACYSGSFIPPLSQLGRMIISSAASDEVSYKGAMEKDGIRSGEFFIEEFFQQLERGKSFKHAFEDATQLTEQFTRRGVLSANINNRFFDDAVQHPLLDDNGDGIGSNALLADGDGQRAASLYLGTGRDFKANDPLDLSAYILEATPTRYLSESESDRSTLLYVKPNVLRKVDPAIVEIRSPSKILEAQESNEQIDIDLEKDFLTEPNEEEERLQITNKGFEESGKYELFYTVQDKDTHEISPVLRSVVYKNRADNNAPQAFNLTSPDDNVQAQTVLILDWENTKEPDGEPFTYTLTIAKDKNFNEVVHRQEELMVSMAYVDDTDLKDLTQYYWQVEAVDFYGAKTRSSDIRTFTTNNPSAPPGIASIQVYNALDYTPLENVNFTFNQNPPIRMFADQGIYNFSLFSGLYQMWLNVPGYLPRRVRAKADFIPLKMTTGQATEIKVLLEPCTDSPCGNPAQFSFGTRLLTIPTVKVPNSGNYSVQLQDDGSFTFTVMYKLTQLSETTDYVAHFSSETGQLFLPRVKVVMPSGEEALYKVTMKRVNSEPLQFGLVDAVEIQ